MKYIKKGLTEVANMWKEDRWDDLACLVISTGTLVIFLYFLGVLIYLKPYQMLIAFLFIVAGISKGIVLGVLIYRATR